jgi:sugar phosphate isomerase/epimerase
MRLCYQVATPDVAKAFGVTAYQGTVEDCLADIASMGYDAIELMTREISLLNRSALEKTLQANGLSVSLVCTGEIFGQGGLNLSDPDPLVRQTAEVKVREIIDLASSLGANINIGRVRGNYCNELSQEQTRGLAVDAFARLAEYADKKHVWIALEPITVLQTRFLNTVQETATFAAEVGAPNLGYMMDLFHMNIEETDVLRTIQELGGQCLHVHLADKNRRHPGYGGFDFRTILEAFYQSGYKGDFCTEIWQLPDQRAAAQYTIEHLRPIFADVYGRGKEP